MRALFFSHSSGLYGAEQCLLDLLRGLPPTFEPMVVLPAPGPLEPELAALDVPRAVVPFWGWRGTASYSAKGAVRTVLNLGSLGARLGSLRRLRPDVVHSNSLQAPYGALVAKALRVPHVWHAHEFVQGPDLPRFDLGLATAMRFVRAASRFVVTNSQVLADHLAQFVPASHLQVARNGVIDDYTAPPPVPPVRVPPEARRSLALLMVGSLSANKGHADAIRALPRLRRDGWAPHLVVVGDGPPAVQRDLRSLAASLGVTDLVQWEGFQRDVSRYYAASDLVLVCSRRETFCRVAAEAMAAGVPVVTSTNPGVLEFLRDGHHGLTYPAGNVAELTVAIGRLCAEPELYRACSQGALDFAHSAAGFGKARYARTVARVLDLAAQAS